MVTGFLCLAAISHLRQRLLDNMAVQQFCSDKLHL